MSATTGGAITGGALEWHNVGPLTTVFTAPEACSTEGVTFSGLGDDSFPWAMRLPINENCEPRKIAASCRPNGEAVEEVYEEHTDRDERALTTAHYYSPANQCPDAWETVGIIAMNNGSASASGLFKPSGFAQGAPGETTSFPPADFPANMLTSILEPTHTAIACCPSGYSVHPFVGCYSNFPVSELASKEGCRVQYTGGGGGDGNDDPFNQFTTMTFEYFDTTTTVSMRVPFVENLPTGWRETAAETETVTFDSNGIPAPTGGPDSSPSNATASGLRQAWPIFLVNSGEDSEDDGGNGDGNGDDDDEDEDGNGGSGARALTPSSWGAIGAVMAVWGISMAAGVGLLAAW